MSHDVNITVIVGFDFDFHPAQVKRWGTPRGTTPMRRIEKEVVSCATRPPVALPRRTIPPLEDEPDKSGFIRIRDIKEFAEVLDIVASRAKRPPVVPVDHEPALALKRGTFALDERGEFVHPPTDIFIYLLPDTRIDDGGAEGVL